MAKGKWQTFSWDGMNIDLPPEWAPCWIEHKPKEILVRIEDDEGAERVQLKLQDIKGKFSVERNIAVIEKGVRKARKKAKDLEFRTGVTIPMVKKTFRNRQFSTFGWTEGDLIAWGLLIACEKCQRASMMQVISGKENDDPKMAGRILSSFVDHIDGDVAHWSAFGVEFDMPRSFRHTDHGYDPRGLFRVTLKDGNDSASILRWNLANMMLKGKDLEGFARDSFKKDFHVYNLSVKQLKLAGHPAIAFSYDKTRLISRVKAAVGTRLPSIKPRYMCGALWHCKKSNRLFSVSFLSNAIDTSDRVAAIALTVKCCTAMKRGGA